MRDQDLIVMIVILAVSALSTLLQKRRQSRQAPPLPEDFREPAAPGREPKAFNLEEQLRRILEGVSPAERPGPRPMIPQQAPPLSAPPPLPPALAPQVVYAETEGPAAGAMVRLAQAEQAHLRAAQLSELAAAHLRHAHEARERVATPPGGRARSATPAIAKARAQFRTPQTTQQALITAMILGPPKAFSPGEN